MSFSKLGKLAAASLLSATLAVSALTPAQASPYLDSDGDKLLDSWELNGYDANGDGIIDIDLPTMGANPYKKDLFVEMDWMPGLLGTEEDLNRIVKEFADLPLRNPDGTTGVNIHLDAGSERSAKYNLGGGNVLPYSALENGIRGVVDYRNNYSDPNRKGIFYYMVWGDKYGTNGSSGVAWMHGMEFLVSVGPSYWGTASSDVKVGTFIHELGHNLGLGHGGTDEVNFKPNYLSIMNYAYQLGGVPHQGGKKFMYSTRAAASLNEAALQEKRGFGASTLGYLFNNAPAHRNVDFNKNGKIDTVAVTADLNNDGQYTVLSAPNDMLSMTFQPRGRATVGGATPSSHDHDHDHDHEELEAHENELTAEIARELKMIP